MIAGRCDVIIFIYYFIKQMVFWKKIFWRAESKVETKTARKGSWSNLDYYKNLATSKAFESLWGKIDGVPEYQKALALFPKISQSLSWTQLVRLMWWRWEIVQILSSSGNDVDQDREKIQVLINNYSNSFDIIWVWSTVKMSYPEMYEYLERIWVNFYPEIK